MNKIENKCIYCGSTEIVPDIQLGKMAESGHIGLQYSKFFIGTEPIVADLCKSCGSIARFHVKETDRKWVRVSKKKS